MSAKLNLRENARRLLGSMIAPGAAALVIGGPPAVPFAMAGALLTEVLCICRDRYEAPIVPEQIVAKVIPQGEPTQETDLAARLDDAAALVPANCHADLSTLAAAVRKREGVEKLDDLVEAVVRLYDRTGEITDDPTKLTQLLIVQGDYFGPNGRKVDTSGGDYVEQKHVHIHPSASAEPPAPPPAPPDVIPYPDHHILPGRREVVADFCGREDELGQIAAAMAGGDRTIGVIGLGGQGKSSLLGRWYDDNHDALADRAIFWCRPYEADYTFERFLLEILPYLMGEAFQPIEHQSTRSKQNLLCNVLRNKPAVIVLDGVERWLKAWADDRDATGENATPEDRRGTADGLDIFLADAGEWGPGSALVFTSRALPASLGDVTKTLIGERTDGQEKSLPGLADGPAVELLGKLGVRGDPGEILRLAGTYDNHPLLLRVMGAVLRRLYGGDIAKADQIEPLTDDVTNEARLAHLLGKVAAHHAEHTDLLGLIACCLDRAPVGMLAEITDCDQREMRKRLAALADWQLVTFDGAGADQHALLRHYFLTQLDEGRKASLATRLAHWHAKQAAQTIGPQPQTLQEVTPLIYAARYAILAGDPYLATDYTHGTAVGQNHQTLSGWLDAFGFLSVDIELYTAIIAAYERQGPDSGDDDRRNDLASAYNNRGLARAGLGEAAEAVEDHDKAIEIRETLVHQEDRRELRNDLAGAYNNRGIAKAHLDEAAKAVEDYDKAVIIRETLVHQDNQQELRNDLATAYNNRGNAKANLGEAAEAVGDYDKAIGIYETLVHQEDRREPRNPLAMAYNNRGLARGYLGEAAKAVGDYDKAVDIYEILVHQEGRRELTPGLATTHIGRGITNLNMDQTEAAAVDLKRGLSLVFPMAEAGMLHLVPLCVGPFGSLCKALIDSNHADEATKWVVRALAALNATIDAGEPSYVLKKETTDFYNELVPHLDALVGAGLDLARFTAPGVAMGVITDEYPADVGGGG